VLFDWLRGRQPCLSRATLFHTCRHLPEDLFPARLGDLPSAPLLQLWWASLGQAQHGDKVSLPPAHTGQPNQFWCPGPTRHAPLLLGSLGPPPWQTGGRAPQPVEAACAPVSTTTQMTISAHFQGVNTRCTLSRMASVVISPRTRCGFQAGV
jgi:hypothetical protein